MRGDLPEALFFIHYHSLCFSCYCHIYTQPWLVIFYLPCSHAVNEFQSTTYLMTIYVYVLNRVLGSIYSLSLLFLRWGALLRLGGGICYLFYSAKPLERKT